MKNIPQLRCNLFMLSYEEYDCSMGGNWTVDWSTRGTERPLFGAFCLIFALVTIPPYLMSAQVIWTMRRSDTYKILFFLAISDIAALFLNSFTFGIFLIMVTSECVCACQNDELEGEVYCHHPLMHSVNALLAMFFFTLSCITCVVLAINRMLDLVSGRLSSLMFRGSRTWYLLTLILIYPFTLAFFTPLLIFNSDYHILIINPGIYEDRYEYYNVGHIFNNTVMPCLSFVAYIIMLIYLLFKRSANALQNKTNVLNKAAMMLSIQSGIIVVVHSATGITYMISQYVPPSDAFLYMAQISWQLLHGTPPFIYLVFNASLREGVRQYAAPVRTSLILLPSSVSPKQTSHIPSRIDHPSHVQSQPI